MPEQHHVEQAWKHKEKPAKKGRTALFAFDQSAPPDMRKLLAEWLSTPNGTPCSIREDPASRKLSQEDIDVFLWVKAMPPDKKELHHFRDLIFKVFLPADGSASKIKRGLL